MMQKRKLTKKHKIRISDSLLAFYKTEKGKLEKINKSNQSRGRKHSEETKRKISKLLTGIKRSDETKRKISQNKERAKKISKSRKGQKLSNEHKKKISLHHHDVSGKNNHMYGKIHKKSTIYKISIKRKEWNKKHPGYQSGDKNPKWRGGSSLEPYGIKFNNKLKDIVRNKYQCQCQICKIKQNELTRKLDVHHIDYNKKNNSLDNFVPLCRKCHNLTYNMRCFWKVYFKERDKTPGELVMLALKEPEVFDVKRWKNDI